jgi:hypothetical protein
VTTRECKRAIPRLLHIHVFVAIEQAAFSNF